MTLIRSLARPLTLFYLAVVATSLAGAAQAAQSWLGWPWWVALGAVGALELGGVVLAHHADTRRQMGESALTARVISGMVAVSAVAANILGHQSSPGQAAFFGGMSALGYAVYLITSGARRRDAMRASGLMVEVPPAYGLWQWVAEPRITRAARVLAQRRAAERTADPSVPRLDALASLAMARQSARAAVRQAAIARVLHRKIRSAVDRDSADIATSVYDLDEVAARLAASADYDRLAGLIGADLHPSRLVGADTTAPVSPDIKAPKMPAEQVVSEVPERTQPEPKTRTRKASAGDRIAAATAKAPAASSTEIALLAGVSDRTVRRHQSKPALA